MKIDLFAQGAGTTKLVLDAAESFYIRQHALLAMSTSTHVSLGGTRHGIHELINGDQVNEFWLAGQLSGEARAVELEDQPILVQQDVFLGADTSLTIEPAHSPLSLSGHTWFKINGRGTVLLSALGAIYPLQVDSEYIVNTAYIVAYSAGLKHEELASGDEGADITSATYKFLGKGFIWCQTHHPNVLGALLSPQLKKRKT